MTMMNPMTRCLSLSLSLALAASSIALAACDAPPASPSGISLRDGPGSGGPWGNTNVIDATDVAQVDTQGGALDGVTLTSVKVLVAGVPTPIDPGSLVVHNGTVAATIDGIEVLGLDFIGSTWSFDADGAPLVATLTTVETADDGGLYDPVTPDALLKLDPERLVYTFTYDLGSGPLATCAEDSDAGARAVLYGGIYVDHATGKIISRPDTVYFGCISGAVGKSALHGYAPDSPSLDSVTLPEFEMAVHAVRADYCGDGTSYTDVGNLLTYSDRYGINSHTEASFTTEALWRPGIGALCVNRIRNTGATLLSPLICGDGHKIPLCGSAATVQARWNSDYGALWTAIPPL